MEKIDVVIVGGGLSGLACAYRLADSGLQVIVLERGDFPGSKNVTGGRLYFEPIKPLIGDMFNDAPFERKIVRERWSLFGEANSLNIDFTGERIRNTGHSYSILRATFDRWLAERLMEKGVFVIPKYRVDDLLWEGDKVCGIKSGQEEIPASVVVAADGVLSFMGERAGLKPKMKPKNYAVGIKEVIELTKEKINDRFNVEEDEGCAHLFIGDVTKGMFGGGFLYTNRETVSLGIVVGIKAIMEKSGTIEAHALLDAFKERYEIKRLIEGGSIVEYSAHVIPEGGYNNISKLYGNGILLTGDAAGFALNMGVTVRGMEFAIASGIIAADTIIYANEKGDFSKNTLSLYEERLKNSFVLKDMYNCKDMPEFLDNDAFFTFYPRYFPQFVEKVIWFGAGPKEKIGSTLWKELKTSGMLSFKRLKELYSIKNI
ncbi:MAG TPA: FAD-dependent oxidoreductase [Syntrophorhabdaceae bacterium]|nr:FAD-dependent oxidoreductase [Syntrophorhabdaceae bacterium]HPP06890.1 FAD-dependent oxidoreductase [Syntrophorhabdaceae bacterium]